MLPPRKFGEETNHAFFPLYPLLMRAFMRTTGSRPPSPET